LIHGVENKKGERHQERGVGAYQESHPETQSRKIPFAIEGFFRDRKRNRRKRDRKNIQLVWDIIVDDINRNQMEIVPKMDARRPTVLLKISLPRK
jgi:hypothetical protein